MKNLDKYVGLDVHKDTTVIAVAEGGRNGDGARQRGEGVALNGAKGEVNGCPHRGQ